MVLVRHAAALIALALALPLGHAQTQTPSRAGASKSLGGGKPTGKLLTREELRACFRLQDKLKAERAEFEPQRIEHERVKAEIVQAGEALAAEKAAIEQRNAATVAAHNVRSAAHTERVNGWNQRNNALAEMVKSRAPRSDIERESSALTHDQAEITKAGDALNAEAETANRAMTEAWTAFNAKAEARNRQIEAFNQRSPALVERSRALASENDRWRAECADRPYREDDEILIKSGK